MKFILIFLSLFLSASLSAQAERFTEEEMLLQDKFIEAYKEKNLGKIDKAIVLFEEVYKADRKNAAVAFELARAYSVQEDLENTKKYIEQACKNEPSNKWYQEFKAEFYKKTSEMEGSIAALKKLVELEPKNEKYAYELGTLYENDDNSAFAIDVYDNLENQIGIYEETSRRKFEAYNRLGDTDKAITELVSLVNAFPQQTRYLNNLASYYQEIGKDKNAKATYQKVLTIEPDNPDATIALAGDVTKPGNEAAYLIALKTIINSPDVDIDTKIKELIPYVTQMSNDAEDPDNKSLLSAIELLQNVHPNEAKSYAIHADVLMNLGRTDDAIDRYAKTLSLNKSVYAVWEQYMYALESKSNYSKLLEASNEALDLYPNQALCYYFNGTSQLQLGNEKAADEMFEEALLIGRRNEGLKKRIEQVKSNAQSKGELKEWAFMRKLDANAPSTLEAYGDHLQQNGEIDKAIKYWKEAIRKGGNATALEQKISSIKIK